MNKKVLLVADDEELNRKIIHKFLQDSFEILEAANGEETLQMLQNNHVDALLLDIIMPEPDGLAVLKTLREEMKNDAIGVLVATSVKESTERTALSLGADDVVAKPYDPIVIKKRLANVLDAKEAHAQKQLAQTGSYDALLQKDVAAAYAPVKEAAERIQKYADIIKGNKENFTLVAEFTQQIVGEAQKLMSGVPSETVVENKNE